MESSDQRNNWKEKLSDIFKNPLYGKKILDALKNHKKINLDELFKDVPGVSEIPENPIYTKEIAQTPDDYPEALSLLCLHKYAQKGECFSDFPLKEQENILENAAYASLEAVSIAQKLDERELEASYWEMAGNALYRLRQFPDAERTYSEALEIFTDLEEKHKFSLAIALGNIGNFYTNVGKFSQAEKNHDKALQIMEDLKEKNPDKYKPHLATIFNNFGDFYRDAGKFFEAKEAYRKALKIREKLARSNPEEYDPTVASTLNSLGLLQFDTELSRAKAEYEMLKEKKEEPKREPKKETEAEILRKTKNHSDALEKAKEKYDRVLKEIRGNYERALEIYELLAKEDPQKYSPNVAGCYNNIANFYEEDEKLNQAEKFYKKALEQYRILENLNPAAYTGNVATSLNNLGVLHNKDGNPLQAKENYNEAIRKYKQVAMWFDAARTYYNLSLVEPDAEALENSRRLLELAILFSGEEKYRYAHKGEKESIYLSLLEKDVSAFGVLEALRDPELLSLLWDGVLRREDLEKAQNDLELQKKVVEKYVLKKNAEKTVPDHKSTILREDLTFIYIQIIKGLAHFFVVDDGTIKRFKCQEDFFGKGVGVYYCLVAQQENRGGGVEIFETLSRQWYKTLPQEITELIQQKDYIVFSPDYYCSFLPLEALQRDNEPLCLEKTVVRATSLRHFSFGSESTALPLDSSLVVSNPWPEPSGNIEFSNGKELKYSLPSHPEKFYEISYLRGAEKEAEELKKQFRKSESREKEKNEKEKNEKEKGSKHIFLKGNEATGEKFLEEIPKYSIIHFSGHGSLGNILFLSGPLKGFQPPFEPKEFTNLRKAERIEGIQKINMMDEWYPVTDLDIADKKLKKDAIVFLNACETGQHRYERGGYFQGLSAAFLKNGVHSVISSLIPLVDYTSGEFASEFYNNLLKSKSVSQSLKEARTKIKNKYKAQIYWIPYLHYGSPF
jgi:CHAT domain-containing protein/lipopolysaccharide biosynthesis regulator YciM